MSYFRFFIYALIVAAPFQELKCQLNLSTTPTPTQLVQNTLVGGGVTTSNISYTGGTASRATFTNGNSTNLGLNNGIVLSTCPASIILNPVNYLASNNLGLAGDADLNAINNGCQTYDASVLEFDFIPMSDTVKFRYVFGSEEYPNYVCSEYNDVFAFFVTGPNPTGGNYNDYNIARIPGTNLPVSVNSVNSGTPGGSYSASGCTSLSFANYYVNNIAAGGTNIAFNGFTKPLTAWCKVVPCQTYHIKIAVADGYNGLYDSAVFLEANSFISNTYQITPSYSNPASNQAQEGCTQGAFTFKLSAPASSPYTIDYTLSGNATNGVDFTQIPTSVTIPAGQDSAFITINPLPDGINEGNETVSITYTSGCSTQTCTINITDYTPLAISLNNDTALCEGNQLTLNAIVTGGSLPYNFSWSNNSTGSPQITVSPSSNIAYTLSVTDNCANVITASVDVTVNTLTLTTQATDEQCGLANGSVSVTAVSDCTGNPSYTWNTLPVSANEAVYNLPAGSYTVTVTCGVCTKTATAIINNHQNVLINVVSVNAAHCATADGSAEVSVSGGSTPYAYQWNSGPQQASNLIQEVTAGNYTLTVTDAAGCVATAALTIGQYPGPEASFTADPAVTTVGNNITFYNFSSGAQQSLWNFDDGSGSNELNPVHSYETAGSYMVWLHVSDGFNCTDSISGEVVVNEEVSFYIPNAFTPDGDGINDFFGPQGLGLNNEDYELYIYDRWGKLQFQTNDINQQWDGRCMSTGTACPQDVYTWVIVMKNFEWDDKLYRHTGVVNLLKIL